MNESEIDWDWLQAHGEDMIPVRLIDLLSAVARMEQTLGDPSFASGSVTEERIYSCDLPRLRGYLPAEALEVLEEER